MILNFDDTTPEKDVVIMDANDEEGLTFVIKRFQWGTKDMKNGVFFLEVKDPIAKSKAILGLTDNGTVGNDRLWVRWNPPEDRFLNKVFGVRLGVLVPPRERPVFSSQRFVFSLREGRKTTTLAEMLASVSDGDGALTEESLANIFKEE